VIPFRRTKRFFGHTDSLKITQHTRKTINGAWSSVSYLSFSSYLRLNSLSYGRKYGSRSSCASSSGTWTSIGSILACLPPMVGGEIVDYDRNNQNLETCRCVVVLYLFYYYYYLSVLAATQRLMSTLVVT